MLDLLCVRPAEDGWTVEPGERSRLGFVFCIDVGCSLFVVRLLLTAQSNGGLRAVVGMLCLLLEIDGGSAVRWSREDGHPVVVID